MLQIVTKMYFREGVPLNSTEHREVLYTNRDFLRGDSQDLPVGRLAPSTSSAPVSTVALSVTEHLEAEDPDGERSVLVSTGGTVLVDDLADVLSFGLNSVFSRDGDLVERLVGSPQQQPNRPAAPKIFRDTFDPARYVSDTELDELRRFMELLLALERRHFEAAMRAIRRIVHAVQRAEINPTVAYVDLVAALESLSEGTTAPAPSWEQMDRRKARLLDEVLDDADADLADSVRCAVMEAERLGAGSRFVAFVVDHVSPEYFREEASEALRPVRGADLERVLRLAYKVRSRNVHLLEDLPPEAFVLGERADTVSPPDIGTMLSLEGLARLARHVVRNYVDRAPVGVDTTFNWRRSLPGQVQVSLAPQYWIWNAAGFGHASAERYFSGFSEHLLATFDGSNEGVTEMQAVLERIEELVPGTAEGRTKQAMAATYVLWHRFLVPDAHRPNSSGFLEEYEKLLQPPGIPAFVVGVLSNRLPDWSPDQWLTLASERRAERTGRIHLQIPPALDAALQGIAAEVLVEAGRRDEAALLARNAIEEMPGNAELIAWERGLLAGEAIELDLNVLIDGKPREDKPSPEAGS